jgi:hypothetical protein
MMGNVAMFDVGAAATEVDVPPAAETSAAETDSAWATGQTVVVMATTSVMTPFPAADRAGQSVIEAAQLVIV